MGPAETPVLFVSGGRETLYLAPDVMGSLPSHLALDLGCGRSHVSVPAMAFLDDSRRTPGSIPILMASNGAARISKPRTGASRSPAPMYSRRRTTPREASPLTMSNSLSAGNFDRALVPSVFTHLRESGTARYIPKLRRVLRPGGLRLTSLVHFSTGGMQRQPLPAEPRRQPGAKPPSPLTLYLGIDPILSP